ncbi:diguanylate cyclase domain-containing protein [Haloplasma contractile]|uniref:Sensory box-containing diguanylate cyclase protein n=1 Tax=Haloplasma contractile SSD-17B TaxID=1033810 RepID=F7PWA6_9MOLU|nr:HD domain-containing phosphohydrolase [Haloplasma contractile]ERJ11236.1 Putative sensory box-containing diguanylate cyclase protein [Haloplasma contractile SSD-17B]
MDLINYKKLLDISSIGYIYCKISWSSSGTIKGYTVVDTNRFFEQHFINSDHIEHSVLKSEYPTLIENLKQSIIAHYDSQFTVYSKNKRQWYDIRLTVLDHDIIVIHGRVSDRSNLSSPDEITIHDSVTVTIDKEEFIQSILLATNELLTNNDFNKSIIKSLSIVGNAIDIDQIYICKHDDAKRVINDLIEWTSNNPNIQFSEFDITKDNKHYKLLIEILNKKRFITAITKNIESEELKRLYVSKGIVSTFILPIFIKDTFWGFIAFNEYKYERSWFKQEIDLLKLFTESISKAIERKIDEDEKEYLSFHDTLTGLYNRRFFEREFKQVDTIQKMPISIIVADVNGLKLVNDAFGHVKGDQVLQAAAAIIKQECRESDIVARWGGDEFIILLPQTNSIEADRIIKRINQKASDTYVDSVFISISMASATKVNVNDDLNKVLKLAEDVMYKHKLVESASVRGKTINAIIHALHEKNKREEEHSKRVSALCGKIGTAMGLPEGDIRNLKTIGLLHDIGKIAISETILNKKGKLNTEEWNEIKRHSEIGYRILSCSNDMSEIAEYVLKHHERLDGTGYPNGIKGEDIPLLTRILSLADAYDAMTSARSYREPLDEYQIVRELVLNSCTQFDHNIARVHVEKVMKLPWYSVMYGVNNAVIETGSTFNPLQGITVYDSEDPNLSIHDIHIIGDVNTNKTGTYSLIYMIENRHGSIERIGRKVSVGKLTQTNIIKTECEKWKTIEIDGAEFKCSLKGHNIDLDITKGGSNSWSSQLVYPSIKLEKDKEYVIRFEALSDIKDKELFVSVGWLDVEHDYWHSFLKTSDNKFILSSYAQMYELIFKMDDNTYVDADLKFEFGTGGKGNICIKDVSILEFIR